MNVLVTGGRAPICLELGRLLKPSVNSIQLSDCVRFPVCRFSNRFDKYHRFASPNEDFNAFRLSIQSIIRQNKIDLLIPTCEEIFFLAKMESELGCDFFGGNFDTLSALHNKRTFASIAANTFATVPESIEISQKEEVDKLEGELDEWVLKPVFSRFADKTLIGPTRKTLESIEPSLSAPWIAQRRIRGKEFSSFSVFHDGQIKAHVCYFSKYRAGIGAGIYLESVEHEPVRNYVAELGRHLGLQGQFGFDFIEGDDGRLWAIECNPRATSGWHFLAEQPGVENLLTRTDRPIPNSGLLEVPSGIKRMVAFAMPIWGLQSALRKGRLLQLVPDCFRARDVVFRWRDPMPALAGAAIGMGELFWISFRRGISPQHASTVDFEFNGQAIDLKRGNSASEQG